MMGVALELLRIYHSSVETGFCIHVDWSIDSTRKRAVQTSQVVCGVGGGGLGCFESRCRCRARHEMQMYLLLVDGEIHVLGAGRYAQKDLTGILRYSAYS